MYYSQIVFHDRNDAGKYLAKKLLPYTFEKPIILAMPPQGVPVAAKVAEALGSPLDVVVARPLYSSKHPHIEFGSIGAGDVVVLDRTIQQSLEISNDEVRKIIKTEKKELVKDMVQFNSGAHIKRDAAPHTLIIVDDGTAKGTTVRAAIEAAKTLYNPHSVVFASPICGQDTITMIKGIVDDIVCINNPHHLYAIGNWYDKYTYVSTEEVAQHLKQGM